jgi:hypothetical protein
MSYIIYDQTLNKNIGEPIEDYRAALMAAMDYSEKTHGHVVRVRPAEQA